jgi:hypothetical protein
MEEQEGGRRKKTVILCGIRTKKNMYVILLQEKQHKELHNLVWYWGFA